MNIYECSEDQFIENIRRLVEAGNKFIVNRRIILQDDYRYGLAILPDKEFEAYESICYRKGYKHTVYARVPFIDELHRRLYNANDVLHSSNNLTMPRLSLPYYRVEYSFSIWGSTYIHTFDLILKPEIRLEKRRVARFDNMLVHTLRFNTPDERMLSLALPDGVVVLDVKKLTRVVDR